MNGGRDILRSRLRGETPSRQSFLTKASKLWRFSSTAVSTKKKIESGGRLSDWVSRIQAACAREASNSLELARLMAQARRSLPYGSWSKLWESGEKQLVSFSKRKGEMLVTIGDCVEGLDAQSSAHLPAAWNTLYYLARLGRKKMEQLIGQGRIHPSSSLEDAKALLAEYLPKIRRTNLRSKLQPRVARFAAFIRTNFRTWSQRDRDTVAEKLAALAREIEASYEQQP